MYADWTDRIAGGELPAAQPPRPQGKERNVVVTMWDWADPKAYLHDEIASDKRNPTVNANGPIYGALEASADYLPVVDPVRNTATQVKLTVRDPKTPSEGDTPPAQPSPYWGDEAIWTSQANAHSFAMDSEGRVWIAARIRQNQTPAFCQQGSTIRRRRRSRSIRAAGRCRCTIPKTKQVTTVDTCFGTHHLNFDNNDMLWFTGGGPVEGWFNTKIYDETKDEAEGAGLDARSCSTPTATASATRMSSPISRSIRRRTSASTRRSTAWRRVRSTARSGDRCSACRARSFG